MPAVGRPAASNTRVIVPDLTPHPWIRGGHLQTLAGFFFPGRQFPYQAQKRFVEAEGGDRFVLHDDCPSQWSPGDLAVLLMHGLAGCHLSPYMVRIAGKLNELGVRTFRMDLRGCGAGKALARLPYHSGLSSDARAALETMARLCPESPLGAVGFSLSGNILLKLLGESAALPLPNLVRAAAVSPPIDLLACSARLAQRWCRLYDWYFVRVLMRSLEERRTLVPDMVWPTFPRRPTRLREFDDHYTAPVSGFDDATTYYVRCSSAPLLEAIEIPTLVLTARDDPLIPVESFEEAKVSSEVVVALASTGGHLGFLARRGYDPDSRWMDWRVIEWLRA